jgi:hypothetical protein
MHYSKLAKFQKVGGTVRGWLWADGAWTARGGGDGGAVLVPA